MDGNGSNNAVYLAKNGITIKASAGAVAGDTGDVNEFAFAMNRFYNGTASMSNKAPKDYPSGRSVWPIRKF